MELWLVVVILFVAFLVRALFGFGDALIAMPLLTLSLGIKTAAPLMAMLALIIAILIFYRYRKEVQYRTALGLIVPAIAGIPVGLYYLDAFSEHVIRIILGAIIIVFVLFRMSCVTFRKRTPPVITILVGFISGALGSAYNTNGPPVIMLLSSKNWNPQQFRATLQAFFLFTGAGTVSGHLIAGNINSDTLKYFLAGLPVILVTFFTGEMLFKKFNTRRFYIWVDVLLMALGLVLIGNELF